MKFNCVPQNILKQALSFPVMLQSSLTVCINDVSLNNTKR